MDYTTVKKILEDNDEEAIQEYKELVPMFRLMEELAGILRERGINGVRSILIFRKARYCWIKKVIR